MRRAARLALIGTVGIAAWPAVAENPRPDDVPAERPADLLRQAGLNAKAQEAVRSGLEWLARSQNPDGSWSAWVGYKLNTEYRKERHAPEVGVSGLAGIAFLANGHVPGRGRYGQTVAKAVDYVAGRVEPSGFITDNESRMYSHAFAGLFLAEVYGQTHRADLRERLGRVVKLLTAAQAHNEHGGWRYDPASRDADISLTVCQLQLLRAALNAGITVPKSVIDKAVEYVLTCRSRGGDGSRFNYQHTQGSRSTFALTAAGMVSLYSAGVYGDPDLRRSAQTLYQMSDDIRYGEFSYFYGHYYGVQAFWQAGEYWDKYFVRLRDELVANQESNGSWVDSVDPAYATSMAILILSIPNGYLPIFQR